MNNRDIGEILIKTVGGILTTLMIVAVLSVIGAILYSILSIMGWSTLIFLPIIMIIGYVVGSCISNPDETLKESFDKDIKSIKDAMGLKKNV